jgi:hypothetical protein
VGSADECGPPADLGVKEQIKVIPKSIYPNFTNSLLVTSREPVSSDSLVWINQLAIPPQNISVIGRYQLKVTVPPNDALKALLKAPVIDPSDRGDLGPLLPQACLVLAIPGVTGSDAKKPYLSTTLYLQDGQSSTPIIIDPPSGTPGRTVTLTVNDPSIDLTKATNVTVGGQNATIINKKQANQIAFRVPLILNGATSPTETDIIVSFPPPKADQVVPNKFTYIPPTPQAKTSSTSP